MTRLFQIYYFTFGMTLTTWTSLNFQMSLSYIVDAEFQDGCALKIGTFSPRMAAPGASKLRRHSAPAHRSASQSFLKDQVGLLGIKLVGKKVWPGYLPDLNA